jgi:hypothetical protein
VSFESGQRLLPENFYAMIGSVVREETGVGLAFDLPLLFRPAWMRDCDFRFERPTI